VFRGGSVLSVGFSKLHTEPRLVDCSTLEMRRRISTHAEIDAMNRATNLKGASIAVARIGRNGKIALSKPCEHCQNDMLEAGIKKIIYTVDETHWDYLPKEEL